VLDCCKINVYTLQALVRNFILMDMSELILISVARIRKAIIGIIVNMLFNFALEYAI
jgi:hypothetical protein